MIPGDDVDNLISMSRFSERSRSIANEGDEEQVEDEEQNNNNKCQRATLTSFSLFSLFQCTKTCIVDDLNHMSCTIVHNLDD